MCRGADGGWVAVEIKRLGTIDAVEQLTRYLERIRPEPGMGDCRGVLAAQAELVIAAYAPLIALRVGAEKDGWVRLEGECSACLEIPFGGRQC